MTSAFFTRPVRRVPHDRLDGRWMLVIHAAIAHAFLLVREEGFDLAKAGENQVTERLEDVLENRIRIQGAIEGFDTGFFGRVTRGSETVNYSGAKISKKPDLVFHLRREHRTDWDQRQDAIFAECKPVDKEHRLNDHYCAVGKKTSGIERFVIGDYAWAMQQAIMIGYVRGGFRLRPHLIEALADPKRHRELGCPSTLTWVPGDETAANSSHGFCATIHQRSFSWRENGQQASPIELYHSWHSCD